MKRDSCCQIVSKLAFGCSTTLLLIAARLTFDLRPTKSYHAT